LRELLFGILGVFGVVGTEGLLGLGLVMNLVRFSGYFREVEGGVGGFG
jgi:hypothetical protein